ncbi:unnamed protein product [Cuscuta campestris]|uniref:ABC transporter domain-containing protein n=1 Tax=Cuscuta campestris TaxID=132261 RepID=A0A484K296_9ASTE|nr:unnamed protein product [Cuscuta campestris]
MATIGLGAQFFCPKTDPFSSCSGLPTCNVLLIPTTITSQSYFRFPNPIRLRASNSPRSSSETAPGTSSPTPPLNQDTEPKGRDLQTLARRFWKIAAPYWSSEDKVQARLQLAAVFALTLGTTGISVGFNFLGRDFYNALANKDQEQFSKQLLYYIASFAGGIPIFVLRDYARETLALRWRSWMTTNFLERYLKNQTFYKLQSQSTIDNPDQRIVDDLSSFTGTSLSFSLTLFNAAVDLISFSNILYGIYPPLFLVLLAYSIGGTSISIFIGRGLVTLNFLQEKKEADFRYGLMRVRENAESIAFYGGEGNEMQLLLKCFKRAYENLTKILISSRNLEFFTNGYRYLIQILPAAVVAPMFFSGKIEFGVINQSVSAFNHILGDFSLIVFQFQAISAFSAVIDRLGEFDDVLDSSIQKSHDSTEEIQLKYCHVSGSAGLHSNQSVSSVNYVMVLHIEDLTLQTPMSKSPLIKALSLEVFEKDNLLVTGPSGSGKTSLLRAIAGLWNFGKGIITLYAKYKTELSTSGIVSSYIVSSCEINEDTIGHRGRTGGVFFLPQRPYMVLGTLRQQLLYPTWTEDADFPADLSKQTDFPSFFRCDSRVQFAEVDHLKPTTDDLIQVLKDVRLEYLLSRLESLDSMHEWSSVLSLGEQQRLAFARLLLSRPYLVLLDESTSALDEANEDHLYRLIQDAGMTYISIGHRRTLFKHHNKVLQISTADTESANTNWCLNSLNREESLL